jgi:signal transduction histidine kinase
MIKEGPRPLSAKSATRRFAMRNAGIVLFAALALSVFTGAGRAAAADEYAYDRTKELVSLVNDAAGLIAAEGEDALREFKIDGSKWRRLSVYIFILDTDGNMLVHPNPDLQGTNQLGLEDVAGKPIARGIIKAATGYGHEGGSWYHYQWPEPDSIFAVWKTTYSKVVAAPSGKTYIVSAGLYDMKMEKAFVVDMVNDAVAQIEKSGEKAFEELRDPKTQFLYKDTYVFVIGDDGTDLVHPGFPTLEGRNILEFKDDEGKYPIKEMMEKVKSRGAAWVDYMWPKPGESVSSTKSSYVKSAEYGGKRYIVGSGVYLDGAAKKPAPSRATAGELTVLVRDAAGFLEKNGEDAFREFRRKPSKWLNGEMYLFAYDLDGNRVFHAVEPDTEGKNFIDLKDAYGKPIIKMFIDATSGKGGEGWTHYLWPKPDSVFPSWKSSFLKRVTVPSGKTYIIGCGIYNMNIEKDMIAGVVDAAAALIEKEGRAAFAEIRSKAGPFVFLDTYVFVDTPNGDELVNPAFPSVEGRNFKGFRDAGGKIIAEEYIGLALRKGSGWTSYLWPKPGETAPSMKHTYVRKAESGGETFIVGSGAYLER